MISIQVYFWRFYESKGGWGIYKHTENKRAQNITMTWQQMIIITFFWVYLYQ